MIYSLFVLGSLISTPVIVNDTNSQYDAYYNFTLTQDFLTNNGEFSLDFVDNYSNTLKFGKGRYFIEFSPQQTEMYFNTKVELDNEVITYRQTYINDFSSISHLTIVPEWYLPFENINDYVGKTLKFSFSIYGDMDFDSFSKSPTISYFSEYLYNTDTYESAYQSGLSTGLANSQDKINQAYEDGKAVGISEGIARDNDLLDIIVSIPDRFISTFKTIFDFEILGVNVAGLMITIISLGVVIFIIKKVV